MSVEIKDAKKLIFGDFLKENYDNNLDVLISEIRNELPKFGKDLFKFCKFIQSKYGFWVDASYGKDGFVRLGFNLFEEIQIPHD